MKNVGFKGKHKLADHWSKEPYIVVKQPNMGIPVYQVKPENSRGPVKTLHRNMLLPFMSLPSTESPVPVPRRLVSRARTPVVHVPDQDQSSSDESDDYEEFVPYPVDQGESVYPRLSVSVSDQPTGSSSVMEDLISFDDDAEPLLSTLEGSVTSTQESDPQPSPDVEQVEEVFGLDPQCVMISVVL